MDQPKVQQFMFKTRKRLQAALEAVTDVSVARVQDDTPVDSGCLKASIRGSTEASGNELTATISTDVPYAPYVEFGTSKMAPQPFMAPTFEYLRGGGLRQIAQAYKRA